MDFFKCVFLITVCVYSRDNKAHNSFSESFNSSCTTISIPLACRIIYRTTYHDSDQCGFFIFFMNNSIFFFKNGIYNIAQL